jgi:hypothetical protein
MHFLFLVKLASAERAKDKNITVKTSIVEVDS